MQTADTQGIAAVIRDALPEANEIQDTELREAVLRIWSDAWRSSEWEQPSDCPKGVELPATRTLVDHSRAVAALAMSMCDTLCSRNGLDIDRDKVIAIALLHDVCKLHEFTRTPDGFAKSTIGRTYQHGYLSAHWAENAGLGPDVVHAIIAHTPLSAVVPQTQEAVLVHYADFADTDALLLAAGLPLFCKRK